MKKLLLIIITLIVIITFDAFAPVPVGAKVLASIMYLFFIIYIIKN